MLDLVSTITAEQCCCKGGFALVKMCCNLVNNFMVSKIGTPLFGAVCGIYCSVTGGNNVLLGQEKGPSSQR